MPLGLTWVFGFLLLLPSLTISLSLQLPTVKKETSFLYVAFSSCFFTRWRLKGRELKINTPERRAEERGSEPESEPLSFFFFLLLLVLLLRSDEDGAYPMFFLCVCVWVLPFGVTNGFFPLPASSTLFQTCTEKRHPPQSHPSWSGGTARRKKKKSTKNRNDSCSLIGANSRHRGKGRPFLIIEWNIMNPTYIHSSGWWRAGPGRLPFCGFSFLLRIQPPWLYFLGNTRANSGGRK